MTYAYVGLGGNIGNPLRQLRAAKRLLARLPAARLTAFSPIYGSAPLGCPGRQKLYCNAAAELQTRLAPRCLHRRLRAVENKVQRRRRRRAAPRRLDVDYLRHGNARLQSPRLTLPHPRQYCRAFVLRPLADIFAARARPLDAKTNAALKRCDGQILARL